MYFDNSPLTKRILNFNNLNFAYYEECEAWIHRISGLPGTGKTSLAKEYCSADHNRYYVSLKNTSEKTLAYSLACQLNDSSALGLPLEDVMAKIHAVANLNHVKIVIDDSCYSPALKRKILSMATERTRFIIVEDEHIAMESDEHNTRIIPKTPADFCKVFHGYDRSDILRLWAITGGIPAVMNGVDENLTFTENFNKLIIFDSAFINHFPNVMRRYFRSPETYFPILQAIALGKEKISDIAKHAGYPNNKCDTYVKNLIEQGIVFSAKFGESKYSTYHLVNSYYKFWMLYIYENYDMLLLKPEAVRKMIVKSMDIRVVIPAYHECCIKYIKNLSNHELNFAFKQHYNPKEKQPSFDYRGKAITFDITLNCRGDIYAFVFPKKLDIKPTDNSVSLLINAFEKEYGFFSSNQLYIFSIYRFRKGAINEASKCLGFHPVVLEQLIKIY